MNYTLDNCNNPVLVKDMGQGLIEWSDWFNKSVENKRRIVAQTRTPRYFVSTVFLGSDHRFGDSGPPILFETMVFAHDGIAGDDILCYRYCTWNEAWKGHGIVLKAVIDAEISKEDFGTKTEEVYDVLQRELPL